MNPGIVCQFPENIMDVLKWTDLIDITTYFNDQYWIEDRFSIFFCKYLSYEKNFILFTLMLASLFLFAQAGESDKVLMKPALLVIDVQKQFLPMRSMNLSDSSDGRKIRNNFLFPFQPDKSKYKENRCYPK